MNEWTLPFDGLPILEAGAHPDPASGGCFMEYASLLAGERWSDHPRCTHPALAQLARLINDAADAQTRQQLAPLIPEAVGVCGADPRVAPQLVLVCLSRVPGDAGRRWVIRAARRAAHRLERAAAGGAARRWCRLTDSAYRAASADLLMARAVQAIAEDGSGSPTRLAELLADAVATARARLREEAVATTRPVSARRSGPAVASPRPSLQRQRSG